MKTNKSNISYQKLQNGILLFLFSFLFLSGCEEPIQKFETSDGLLIGQYLSGEPETYSTFYNILEITGTLSFLDAYGAYTCFAPSKRILLLIIKKI